MAGGTETIKVFLSAGSAYTAEQEKFIGALEDFLLRNDCKPVTIGHSVFSSTQPIRATREEMQSCDAAVILAFARYEIEKGAEFPGSSKEKRIDGSRIPTAWNQLEGGMAYGLTLPMLILVEKELTRQAVLSDRMEWFPQVIDLDPAILKDKVFIGIFEDWKRRAREHALERKKKSDKPRLTDWTISELTRAIAVGTAFRLIAMLGSLLATAFYAGFWAALKFGHLM
jgi:hypothetical protein